MTDVMPTAPLTQVKSRRLPINAAKATAIGLIALLFLGFSYVDSNVATPANIINVLQQAAFLSLFAAAQTLLLTIRGFDLSLGPTVSLVSVVTALCLVATSGSSFCIPVSLLAGVSAGLAVGVANGYFVSVVGINPFVTTLAMMNVVTTVATTASDGFPVSGLPSGFSAIAFSEVFGLPTPVIIIALVLIMLHILQRTTVFGRSLFLIGSNPRASFTAGVRVRLFTWTAYIVSAGVVAIGAILLTARTGSGEPNLGGNLTLEAIAAAVMGGVSMRGGSSDIFSPILGALFLAILSNGMDSVQVNGFIQEICLGVLIIIGLALDRLRAR